MSGKAAIRGVAVLDVECFVCGAQPGEPCKENIVIRVTSDTLEIRDFASYGERAMPHNSRDLVARWTDAPSSESEDSFPALRTQDQDVSE